MAKEEPDKSNDVVLVHGRTADGKGLKVLRARSTESSAEPRLEVGEVRPLEEGKPITGDVVKLRPRARAPFVCDVETQFELPTNEARGQRQTDVAAPTRPTTAGPAQVASAAYRANWDAIWPSARRDPGLN